MVRSWRGHAESLSHSIKKTDEMLAFMQNKNATEITEIAKDFECPTFPNIGTPKDSWSKDLEPLDAASINRKGDATTFNFCGWCKHCGGGSCRYNYRITTSCSFIDYAGMKDEERKFNTPCIFKTATDQFFNQVREGLAKKRDQVIREKKTTDVKIKKLLKLEEEAEKKPAMPGARPHDWYNINDSVVCYVGEWEEILTDEQFSTAKVISGYRHHDGCVSVCFDKKIHNGDYLDGHGSGYGMSRPEVMHQWEYEYMLTHLDFAKLWAMKGTSGSLEKFNPERFLLALSNEAMKKSINTGEETLDKIRKENASAEVKTKKFHVSDVLSITTGRLVSTRHMDGVYDILNFMTGDNLFTHQLPRASKECTPWLLKQFPELEKAGHYKNLAKLDTLIDDSQYHKESTPDTAVEMWIKWMSEPGMCNLKMEYDIQPLPRGEHQHKDPIHEAQEMMGGKGRVVVVKTP
jgi:hypothetical protein